MRRELLAALTLAASTAAADPERENLSGDTGTLPSPVEGVSPALAIPSNAGVAAALSAKSTSSTQFTVALAPGRALPFSYVEVLSETMLSLVYDSKTTATTFGVTLKYNPFALAGGRVGSIVDGSLAETQCGKAFTDATPGYSALRISETRALRDLEKARAEGKPPEVVREAQARLEAARQMLQAFAPYQAQRKRCERERIADEWSKINATWVPSVALTFGIGVFPSGRASDPLMPAQTATLEPFQGYLTGIDMMFRPAELATLKLFGSFKNTRPTNVPRSRRSNTWGGGVTLSAIVWRFACGETLRESSDYQKSGFIPGINLGLSGQLARCDGGPYCDSGRVRSESLTPFVDVRIKESLQFRLAVPIERNLSVAAGSGVAVAPTVSLAGALSSTP